MAVLALSMRMALRQILNSEPSLKNLSVDGYSILDCSDMTDDEFEQHFTLADKDVESGTIYVLRSKSSRPEIAAIKDLYKIGFTVTSVESRIANAKNEPNLSLLRC